MQVVSVSEDYDSLHYDELNGYYIGSDIYDDIGYLPDTLSHLIMWVVVHCDKLLSMCLKQTKLQVAGSKSNVNYFT